MAVAAALLKSQGETNTAAAAAAAAPSTVMGETKADSRERRPRRDICGCCLARGHNSRMCRAPRERVNNPDYWAIHEPKVRQAMEEQWSDVMHNACVRRLPHSSKHGPNYRGGVMDVGNNTSNH